jgi:hypothetical protein
MRITEGLVAPSSAGAALAHRRIKCGATGAETRKEQREWCGWAVAQEGPSRIKCPPGSWAGGHGPAGRRSPQATQNQPYFGNPYDRPSREPCCSDARAAGGVCPGVRLESRGGVPWTQHLPLRSKRIGLRRDPNLAWLGSSCARKRTTLGIHPQPFDRGRGHERTNHLHTRGRRCL